ncbi:MAG: ABC transporter ATP-binding protein [Clostridia bacterium]
MKRVLSYLKPKIPIMSLQFVIKFVGTIMDLLLPMLLSYILDDIVPTNDMGMVYFWGGIMILCAVVALIFNVWANRMSTVLSRNFTQQYRHDLFVKIASLSSRQTDEFTIPSLISRLTSDTYFVHQMVDRMQRLGIRAPILLLGGILITFNMEPVLTLVLVFTLPILAFIIFMISRKGIPLYTNVQLSQDKLVRKVQENMTGVRVIKALSKTEYEKARFYEVNEEVVKRDQKASIVMAITNPTMSFLLNLGLTLVIIVGAFRVNGGLTQPGKIIAFLSYFTIILNAMVMVTRLFVMYSKGAASAKRIDTVFATENDMKVKPSLKTRENDYAVEFKNVCFSYNKVGNNLNNISFALKKGETLGILGATGSGKSTLISLLLRFYDPDSGSVLIDGIPADEIENEILHTKFGVVFQNDYLFADTILANIDFMRSLSPEAVEKAADFAQADFIKTKERGFLHRLTVKGANLSGGQKQRILIARALANDPEILILDDSSSALDYQTDANLRHALAKNFSDTTTVIVAQRVSSIMNADKIMVLNNGSIIGMGTHSELLSSCPEYSDIFLLQMGESMDN